MTANSRSPVYGAVDIGCQSTQKNICDQQNRHFDLNHLLERGLSLRPRTRRGAYGGELRQAAGAIKPWLIKSSCWGRTIPSCYTLRLFLSWLLLREETAQSS